MTEKKEGEEEFIEQEFGAENKPKTFLERDQERLADPEHIKKWTNYYVEKAEKTLESIKSQAGESEHIYRIYKFVEM